MQLQRPRLAHDRVHQRNTSEAADLRHPCQRRQPGIPTARTATRRSATPAQSINPRDERTRKRDPPHPERWKLVARQAIDLTSRRSLAQAANLYRQRRSRIAHAADVDPRQRRSRAAEHVVTIHRRNKLEDLPPKPNTWENSWKTCCCSPRLDSGGLNLQITGVDRKDLLTDLIRQTEALAEERGISLRSTAPTGALAHPTRLPRYL